MPVTQYPQTIDSIVTEIKDEVKLLEASNKTLIAVNESLTTQNELLKEMF